MELVPFSRTSYCKLSIPMCLFDLVQETDRCLTCVRSTTLWLAAKVRGQGQNSTKRGSVSPPLQYLIHPGLSGTRGRPAFVLGCFFCTGLVLKLPGQALIQQQTSRSRSRQAELTKRQDWRNIQNHHDQTCSCSWYYHYSFEWLSGEKDDQVLTNKRIWN